MTAAAWVLVGAAALVVVVGLAVCTVAALNEAERYELDRLVEEG